MTSTSDRAKISTLERPAESGGAPDSGARRRDRVRVLHVLPSMRGYGAEHLVVQLLGRLASSPEIDAALLTIYEQSPETIAAVPFRTWHAGRKTVRDKLFLAGLVREIRRFSPDIVHTHTHVGKYWGRGAALLAGAPCIVHTEHNPCDFRRTPFERVADRVLDRATARIVTFFPEQGEALRTFERFPVEKLAIIPNGLELGGGAGDRASIRESLGVGRDEFAIVLIGRMEYQKNHGLALEALAAMDETVRNRTRLFFAGSGEEESHLRDRARALGVESRVRFLGYRDDVPALLSAMDLVLMTSWFEGMPLALLEAMAAGIPIVTTPWQGARDMLDDGRFGMLTEGYAPAQVSASIQRAIERPELRAETARRARERGRDEYSVARMVDAHRNLYLQLRAADSSPRRLHRSTS